MENIWSMLCRLFRPNERGGVQILFGLIVPALIGFTGLGTDAVFWLKEKNRLQSAADAAALSAAHSLHLDSTTTQVSSEASAMLQKIYGADYSDVTAATQSPPITGALAGDTTAVEVTAEKDAPVYFARLFGFENVTVSARSVARISDVGDACVLALSTTHDCAIAITGSTVADLNCGIATNSNSSQAIYMSGNATVDTTNVRSVGDVYVGGSANLNTSNGSIKTYAPSLADPYGPLGRDLQVPSLPTGCTSQNLSVGEDMTLAPGRYCGGIRFQHGTATLQPGVYIMDGGDFKANAQAEITGTDVTIILTGGGNSFAQLDVNAGAELSLHAPTSGTDYDGVLFFQDPQAPTYQGNNVHTNKLNGGANLDLSGAMYFPSQALDFKGGASLNISCLQIVALLVTLKGNSSVTNTCDSSSGTERISRLNIELVE